MAASITLTPVPSAVTSGAPGSYTRGEELELDWSVRNTAGTLTEPEELTFTVRTPDGVDTDYVMGADPEITNNGDGTGNLVLVLDQSARWVFRCVTDTPTTAATIDVMVERDAFEDSVVPVPASPGATFDGGIARVASGVYVPYLGTEVGETLTWDGAIWVKRRGWVRPSVDTSGDSSNAATNATNINAALASRTGVCVELPEGDICISSPLAITQTASTLLGRSETGTQLHGVGAANAWIVADGVVTPSIRELCFRNLSTGAAPSSGVGIQLVDCFAPKLENVHITDAYNGVQLDGCLEASLTGRLWFRNLFGVKGLEVIGNSGIAQRVIADNPYPYSADSKSHAARQTSHAYVQGDTYTNNGLIFQCKTGGTSASGGGPTTVPGTTIANARTTDVTDGTAVFVFVGRAIEWIYGGADVAGFTVQSCALLNGYRGFRQAGGNWWFFNHYEIDHPWADGILLGSGSGFRASGQSWISSVFTGTGATVDQGYSGDVLMAGGKVFATGGIGILLQPGPTECYFDRMNIGTCLGLGGFIAGAVGPSGPKHWALTGSRVQDCNFGIAALSSDADYFHVTGNDCEGCSTGVDMSGASGSNKVVENNLD